jgi:glycosyltransferase involved in cell wall biosynthesis
MKKVFRISTVPLSLNSLLKGQLKMLNEHYEIVGVSSPGSELEEVHQREGIRVIALPMERHISLVKDFISLIRMILLFLKEQPDMVHSLTPKAGLISMLAGWITGVPVRMHTFTGLVFPTATGFKQKLLIWMDRLTCACATHINPEGNGVKQDLMRYQITKKPLKIIANGNINGINLNYFQKTPEIMQVAEAYRKEELFTFCFVGRMVRDKGINELVSAFVRLQEKYASTRLILVGPFERNLDPVSPETEKQIFGNPAIEFMDFQKDICPFLAASDALVFPSYREGFPNVVLQAGAMGLPAIVTNINGSNEIIEPGKNGVIIESQNEEQLYLAMENFVLEQDKVRMMAQNCRAIIAEKYDQRIVWAALLDEYKTLLKE